MTFKIKDSLSIDGNVVIDQNKNITANDVTVNGVLTANGSAVQPQLVSGSNIKTINGTSVLGSGDIAITSGGASIIGEIRQITSSTIPYGWLLCDGAAISRSAYALLFAAIGTAYGAGDGSTTFNLPDYRGSMPAGVGLRTGQTLTTPLALGDSYTLLAGSSSAKFNAGEPTTIVGVVATNFIIAATGDAVFVDAPAVITTVNGLVTSKQDTLVSGTNIKTVNGASLLGSGNVDVGGAVNGILKSNGSGVYSAAVAGTDYQVPLVSGTNIKTVNGTSVLGSGDLAITPSWSSITSKPTTVSGYGITDAYSADNTTFTSTRYGSGGAIILRSAAGTQGAPTAITGTTTSGLVVSRGYDGSTYRDVASINAVTDGAVSSTSSPGYLSFSTTPSGSVSSVERLRITSSGALSVAGSTGTSGQVLTSAGTSAAPTWQTPTVSWSSVTSTPTTISGYGITNAQATLVSGTNIKTVNGASLLGSGNVDVGGAVNGILKSNGSGVYSAAVAGTDYQVPLVSGTNIKTVNGTSVLGSGDLVISAGGFAVSIVSANTNAVKSTKYVVTAAATINLPAAPAAGDQVAVVNRSGGTSVVVASNGLNILGSVQDITLDVLNISLTFTYSDAINGWIID